jgi:hypothetical protein
MHWRPHVYTHAAADMGAGKKGPECTARSPHRVSQHSLHQAAHGSQAVLPQAQAQQQRPARARHSELEGGSSEGTLAWAQPGVGGAARWGARARLHDYKVSHARPRDVRSDEG